MQSPSPTAARTCKNVSHLTRKRKHEIQFTSTILIRKSALASWLPHHTSVWATHGLRFLLVSVTWSQLVEKEKQIYKNDKVKRHKNNDSKWLCDLIFCNLRGWSVTAGWQPYISKGWSRGRSMDLWKNKRKWRKGKTEALLFSLR